MGFQIRVKYIKWGPEFVAVVEENQNLINVNVCKPTLLWLTN